MAKKNFNVIGIHCTGVLSSACLISNGKLVYGSPEERLSRVKNDSNFPILTIRHILEKFKLKLNDIDYFAIGWNAGENVSSRFREKFSAHARYPGDFLTSIPNHILTLVEKKKINQTLISFLGDAKSKIVFIDHHMSHLQLGLETGNFSNAAVISTDAWGESKCTVLYNYKNKKVKTFKYFSFPNSIGCFYGAMTNFLGFTPLSDEWKVMGMAAYGNYKKVNKKFFNLIKILPNGEYQLDLKYFDFYNYETKNWYSENLSQMLGSCRGKNEKIKQRHYDIAAATQKLFSNVMNHLIKYTYNKTRQKNLILSGGCAMNSLYNGTIQNLNLFKNINISFSPNDTGNAIGSAIEASKQFYKRKKISNVVSFIGDEYADIEITNELNLYKIKYKKLSHINLIKETSSLLSNGYVIGVFKGKSEFGQRALGNRSIIASPQNKNMKDQINKKIKFRESYRPFAPVIKFEDLNKVFISKEKNPVKYMEKTLKFKKKFLKICPAVVHKDYSGRLQTVDKGFFLYDLINEFEKSTGCPVILNTSFNLNNEPMVHTIKDAIRTFYSSGIDALIINSFLIKK